MMKMDVQIGDRICLKGITEVRNGGRKKKTDKVPYNLHRGAFAEPLLPWKVTHSELLSLALVIQHAMRMRHIAIFGLPVSTIFSTLSHKRYVFRKTIT
jgi:hypothetical protein